MKQELRARLERLGPIQVIDRVPSGSPAEVIIRPDTALAAVKTVSTIHALIRRGVPAKAAMRIVDRMVEVGEAVFEVPTIESGTSFADEMLAAGVQVRRIALLKPDGVKALRERLGLSAAAFAKRYGLNERTVEGWEQGRPMDAVANTYLRTIAANPNVIAKLFEEPIG